MCMDCMGSISDSLDKVVEKYLIPYIGLVSYFNTHVLT